MYKRQGYQKLLREIRIAKRGVLDGTKFDRLLSYRIANLHYLVTEDDLIETHEVPTGWGLLQRRGDSLQLLVEPRWQSIGVEEQLSLIHI